MLEIFSHGLKLLKYYWRDPNFYANTLRVAFGMTTKEQTIEIRMLGGLVLTKGDKQLSEDMGRTKQVWNLLEFLLANRFKDISQDKLIEVLWPYDDCENPANALKNLVYRLRTSLSTLDKDGEKTEYIKLKRGSYSWNNDLPCKIDTEVFESCWKQAGDKSLSDNDRIELYDKAIELYKGDLLPKSAYEEWVVPISEYYRRIFMDCVFHIIELLSKQESYERIIMVCEHAIGLNPFEERVHEQLIRALALTGKQAKAVEHYDYTNNLFYKELGVRTSDSLRSLYKDITKDLQGVEFDIAVIKKELKESTQSPRAFLCNYEVFKNLYRLEARAAERTGQSVFVTLLTVTTKGNVAPDTPVLTTAMDTLERVLIDSLRKGDVVSRFSSTQYVVMLSTLTYENGVKVLDRIQKKFDKLYKNQPVTVHKVLYPIEPT